MLPSRALSLCVAFIILVQCSREGSQGSTVDLIRFVFTLSPLQEAHRIWPRPAHVDRGERWERGRGKGCFESTLDMCKTGLLYMQCRKMAAGKTGAKVQRQKRKSQRGACLQQTSWTSFLTASFQSLQYFIITLAQFSQQLHQDSRDYTRTNLHSI